MLHLNRCAILPLLAVLLVTSPVFAQRGGGRGGFGGGREGGGQEDFRARMLSRMDANGNGMIEPDELDDRARGFVSRMAQDAGLDPNRPLRISQLANPGESRGGNRERSEGSRGNGRGRDDDDEVQYLKVAAFGDPDAVGFGLHPRLLAGRIVDLDAEFDERVLEFANRTMDRYDENDNGILDIEEWGDVRWRDADPRGADVDNDGRLTMAELAQLFGQQSQRQGRGGDNNRGGPFGGRGGDDEAGGRRGGQDGDERRGGRGGGFGRGGFARGDEEGGERGGRGRGGFDPARMIAGMDQNGDGILDPEELGERAGFLAQRFQIDLSGPVSVDEIAGRISAEMGQGEGGGQGQRRNVRPPTPEPVVPSSYRLSGADRLKGLAATRERKVSEPQGLPRWWNDANGNGQVEMSEFLGRARPSSRGVEDFEKHDSNGDGVITPEEAASGDGE